MEFNTIRFEHRETGVAVVTLNRPDAFNAINRELAIELNQLIEQIQDNEEIRATIITGAGKPFCAGGDLSWLLEADDNLKKREIVVRSGELITKLDKINKPLIAAINGATAGAGTAIALACDIIVASEKAKFTPNFVNIGAVPDSGASWYLPRAVGYHKAAELMLMGDVLSAQEAKDLGIFNKVVPGEELEESAMQYARRLAKGPQRSVEYIKDMLKQSQNNTLQAQLEIESSMQIMAWSDPDFQEGVNAFLEKREPDFGKYNKK